MDSLAEKFEFDNGVIGEVHFDFDGEACDPRKMWDHPGTVMLCAHRNYDLGDVQIKDEDEAIVHIFREDGVKASCSKCGQEVDWDSGDWYHFGTFTETGSVEYECGEEEIKPELQNVAILPLYLYEHSGITMKTSAFSDPWDSGQVGVIYMTYKSILSEFGGTEVTEELIQQAKDRMVAEVEEYDLYLTGQVYGYVIKDEDGEVLDSCWGFLGSESVEAEMKASAKHCAEEIQREKDAMTDRLAKIAYETA